jgi:hypothetical protein
MPDLTAKRTLVKSPPELWEELSEVDRLAKHLDAFGEIRITKLEPEHTVAWEGEHASGTVSIEPSGWGTKVTLTAELPEAEPPEPEPAPEPEPPEPAPESEPAPEEPAPQEPVVEEVHADELLFAEPVTWEPPPPRRRRGFWAWLFRERTPPQAPVQAEPEPEPVEYQPVEPEPVEPEPVEPEPVEPEPVEPEAVEPEAVEPEAVEPEAIEPEPVAAPATEAADPAPIEPDPAPAAVATQNAQTALDGMLDSLGSAHHRPFSRG